MFDLLKEDIQAIKDRDPAAKSSLEIFRFKSQSIAVSNLDKDTTGNISILLNSKLFISYYLSFSFI